MRSSLRVAFLGEALGMGGTKDPEGDCHSGTDKERSAKGESDFWQVPDLPSPPLN